MLKSISSGSPWLSINNYQNPPYISPGSISSGMVRYNPGQHRLEVYDGHVWLELGSTANVDLSPSAREVFDWARKKMAEEAEFEQLAKTNPSVQDSLNKVREAEAQLKVVANLVKDHATVS